MGFLFVPVMKAFPADVAAKLAADENGFGKIAPGPSEINAFFRTDPGETASVKDISVRIPLRCGGGRDIAVDRRGSLRIGGGRLGIDGGDFAFLEIGGGASENKINFPTNIAIFIKLPSNTSFTKLGRTDKTTWHIFFFWQRTCK